MAMIESNNRATSDPDARKKVLKQMEKDGIEYVLFWFTDIEGHLKSFAITPSELEDALDDGMGFDGSSITGFNAIEESDMVAIPDPATFRVLPDGQTGRLICDVVTPDGEPFGVTTSQIIRPTFVPLPPGMSWKVSGSGIATMSDSSIALKPVIDEPSNPIPASKASSSSAALMEKDFSWPRMSVNQKRMKRMSRSATIAFTSDAVRGCSSIAAGP